MPPHMLLERGSFRKILLADATLKGAMTGVRLKVTIVRHIQIDVGWLLPADDGLSFVDFRTPRLCFEYSLPRNTHRQGDRFQHARWIGVPSNLHRRRKIHCTPAIDTCEKLLKVCM